MLDTSKKQITFSCFIKYDRSVNIYIFFVYNLHENIIGKTKRLTAYKNNGSPGNCKVVVLDINILPLKTKTDHFYTMHCTVQCNNLITQVFPTYSYTTYSVIRTFTFHRVTFRSFLFYTVSSLMLKNLLSQHSANFFLP